MLRRMHNLCGSKCKIHVSLRELSKHKLRLLELWRVNSEVPRVFFGISAACKDKVIRDICGEAYGELTPMNHVDLK